MLILELERSENVKKLYFKYGKGKTADLCQTAYNYREGGAKVVVMNAFYDEEIESHITINGKKILTLKLKAKFLIPISLLKKIAMNWLLLINTQRTKE